MIDAARTLLQHALERRRVAVAVERVEDVEPGRRRTFERAAPEAELASISALT